MALVNTTPSNDSQLSEMCLTGHAGAIHSIAFDPTGRFLCSGSFDRQVFLWNTDEFSNCNVFSGHKCAVLEVKWLSDCLIASCSADASVCVWDANRGCRVRRLTEHTGVVNSCCNASLSPNLFASCSDDRTAKLWDSRSRHCLKTYNHEFQLCSVTMTSDGKTLFTAGIDGLIRSFDTVAGKQDLVLNGHRDCVTGLAVSSDNLHLMSNSMDSSLQFWSLRSFPNFKRHMGSITGVHHGAEKLLLRCSWSPCHNYVSGGSSDRIVHVWDSQSYNEKFSYAGHKASVNEVVFHPHKPIVASCSSDRHIIIGKYPVN